MTEFSRNQSTDKQTVLFICTDNSVRSQIAEGLMRTLYPDQFEVYSAGIAPAGIHPPAIWTMKEIGIDITRQRSKSFRDFCNWHFDDGVTFSSEVHDALGITTPKARVYLNRPVKTHSDVYENEKRLLRISENYAINYKKSLYTLLARPLIYQRVISTGCLLSIILIRKGECFARMKK